MTKQAAVWLWNEITGTSGEEATFCGGFITAEDVPAMLRIVAMSEAHKKDTQRVAAFLRRWANVLEGRETQ